jgi:hypothetical protein
MTETSAGSAVVDDLPSFASLTSDEDREKKAKRCSPGTYNVVVNQDSFHHLPEYNDDPEARRELLSRLRRGSIPTSLASSAGREFSMKGVAAPGDPNIVVLPRFEGVVRRGTFSSNESPISSTAKNTIIKGEEQDEVVIDEELSSVNDADSMSQDSKYLIQFRHVVWRQLVPAEPDQRDGMVRPSVSVLEAAANGFPPVRRSDIYLYYY